MSGTGKENEVKIVYSPAASSERDKEKKTKS